MLAKLIFKSLLINLQMQIPQRQKPAKVTLKRLLEPFPFQKCGCWKQQQQQIKQSTTKTSQNGGNSLMQFASQLSWISLKPLLAQNFLCTLEKAQHQNCTYKSLELRKHPHSPWNPLEKYEQNKLQVQNQQISQLSTYILCKQCYDTTNSAPFQGVTVGPRHRASCAPVNNNHCNGTVTKQAFQDCHNSAYSARNPACVVLLTAASSNRKDNRFP